MKCRDAGGGFTLIELMIVIAIIAIIAAIAIPGLISSQRGANERNASASLKTTGSAEVDFRQNDRDQNQISDFWIDDVQGLFAIDPQGNRPIKLIELPVARADASPDPSNWPGGTTSAILNFQTSKSGYWFQALTSFENNSGTAQIYDSLGTGRSVSRFGLMAFPDDYGTLGLNVFILSEAHTLYKQDGAQLGMTQGLGSAGAPAVVFPNDPPGSSWSTMD